MNDAAFVSCCQSGADLARDFDSFVCGKPSDAADDGSKVFAINVLHREKRNAINIANIKNAANIGMRNLARNTHFGMKTGQSCGILRKGLRKKLDSHNLAKPQIFSAINLTHSTASSERNNAIAFGDDLSGNKAAATNRIGAGVDTAAGAWV